ncbi:MAG: AmmeMemoRadiSam system radical SAM enzyme [Actinomycetota bacterium]|jgi:pyruvate formate lyase activating enzyme|nr:AmmeMemoRadiSam system radical SAM enzyme [Actinomycetota bacterium]
MKESYLYKRINQSKISCCLCSHRCIITNDGYGKCNVRKNIDGKLFSMNYGHIIAENIDPIEKKPLFHFLPGSLSYSIACPGCNFKCFFCQNHQISQIGKGEAENLGLYYNPEDIVEKAARYGCQSISYTYTEPTVFFELAFDTSIIAKEQGIKNIFITNGFMTKEAIDKIEPYLDAANVDLKGFTDDFYRKYAGARLEPVLENIRYLKSKDIWIEVTTLLIPGLNDSSEEVKAIAKFLKDISIELPWHISAYYPQYKSSIQATDTKKIMEAVGIGKDVGLKYVYAGNILSNDMEDTFCPDCGKLLIKRRGYSILENNIDNNVCKFCKNKISGFF